MKYAPTRKKVLHIKSNIVVFFSFEGTFPTKRHVPWSNVLVTLGWKTHHLELQVLSALPLTIQHHVLS